MLTQCPKKTKRSHCDTSWQVPKPEEDKISKSSQTLETCLPKKSEFSPNPVNSETNPKQRLNQSGMDAKQMIIGDAKALKIPNPTHSLSKITLQSIPKASKSLQEATNASNLRIKALTNNFPLEKSATVQSGSQQDSGKHLVKGVKADVIGETSGNEALESLGRSCKDEACSELASRTPRSETDQSFLNKPPHLNKVFNKVSDKENREDAVTGDRSPNRLKGEELKAFPQTILGSLSRSGTTPVSNKTLKGIKTERREATESGVDDMLSGGLDRSELFEDGLSSSPPPPPSSTPLLLPAPAVVTVSGDRAPNNQLRFESKQHSHVYSRQQQPISSLGPSPLSSTASERCVSCERSFMSDQSNKRKNDVHLPEVRTSTLLEPKARDGKGQRAAASGSEAQPP